MSLESVDFSLPTQAAVRVARINGVALNREDETLAAEDLRQRACTELLRQAAQQDGMLDEDDAAPADGVVSEAATCAIDAWLERELQLPEPTEEACRRHHAAHAARYRTGEKVQVRHVLFAVTPGMDVVALRNRAETCLLDVRCHDGKATPGDSTTTSNSKSYSNSSSHREDSRFNRAARELSNCPTGEAGGELGWLEPEDCAPEFAREIFGHVEVGVLPRLVHSRFGLHVVEVLAREGGVPQSFESVRGAVTMALRQQAWVTALRQCLQLLAGQAVVVGVDLEAAHTPLVQ